MSGRRLASLKQQQFDFVWRMLRRLGLRVSEADHAALAVFETVGERLSLIAEGSERPFLLKAALHIAAAVQGGAATRREDAELPPLTGARDLLLLLLDELDFDCKVAFVLFELEAMTMPEIANILEIPGAIVRWRVLRAQAQFQVAVARRQVREDG